MHHKRLLFMSDQQDHLPHLNENRTDRLDNEPSLQQNVELENAAHLPNNVPINQTLEEKFSKTFNISYEDNLNFAQVFETQQKSLNIRSC